MKYSIILFLSMHISFSFCQDGYRWNSETIRKNNVKKVVVYPISACRGNNSNINNVLPLHEYQFTSKGNLEKEKQYGTSSPTAYDIETIYCYYNEELLLKKEIRCHNDNLKVSWTNFHKFDSINIGFEYQLGQDNNYSIYIENYVRENGMFSIYLDGYSKGRAKIVSIDSVWRDSLVFIQETHNIIERTNWKDIIKSESNIVLIVDSINTMLDSCFRKESNSKVYKYFYDSYNNLVSIIELFKNESQMNNSTIENTYKFEVDQKGLVSKSELYRKNLDSGEVLLLSGFCYKYEFWE